MSGGQVNNPQWQPYQNNTQFEAPPIYQAGVAQQNAAQAQANSNNAATGQWLQFGGSVAGAAL
jgi:hypothetical protein